MEKKDALSNLPNIGTEVEYQLHQVGINTYEELKEIGAEKAWLRIQDIDPSACANRLYGLEGGIQGIPKTQLSPERKSELREFYYQNKK